MKKTGFLFAAFLFALNALAGTPTLQQTAPTRNAATVPLTSKIVLVFNEDVVSGNVPCQLNGESLTPIIVSRYVTFQPKALDYLTPYTFTIPAGSFLSKTGQPFAGDTLHFTTLAKPLPALKTYDAVVAADGSGNYTSVQKAIDAMPNNRTQPWLIFVKNGVYNELIRIPATKTHLHLIGQDKEKTIIQYKINCAGSSTDAAWEYSSNKMGLADGSVVVIEPADFFSENISYINTWGYEIKNGPQALAVKTKNDRAVFNNCKMLSYQDTWQTTTNDADRHYAKNCFIEGAVDFIYCSGDCYLDSCTLNIVRPSGGYIVAPSHGTAVKWGYIFMNCSIVAPQTTSVYFGRPWHNAPKTSFVNTTLGKNLSVYPTGWHNTMGGIPKIFADYNTMNYQGIPVDLSKRNDYYYYTDGTTGKKVEGYAQKTLTPEQVASYTVRNVLGGSDAWRPDEMTKALPAPEVSQKDSVLTWKRIPYAICYTITRNDSVIGFTTDTTFRMQRSGSYRIQTVNEYGGLSACSATQVPTGVDRPATTVDGLDAVLVGSTLKIKRSPEPVAVRLYSLQGKLLRQETLFEGSSTKLTQQTPCLIRLEAGTKAQTLKYLPE